MRARAAGFALVGAALLILAVGSWSWPHLLLSLAGAVCLMNSGLLFRRRRVQVAERRPVARSLTLECPACHCAVCLDDIETHVQCHVDELRDPNDTRSVAEKLGRNESLFVIEENP